MTKVTFHPEAEAELDNARTWYRERNQVAGRAFVAEVLSALKSIAETPERGHELEQMSGGLSSSDFRTPSSIGFAKTKCLSRRLLTKGDVPVTGADVSEGKRNT
jgi:plasmid stabilization system protein ParE